MTIRTVVKDIKADPSGYLLVLALIGCIVWAGFALSTKQSTADYCKSHECETTSQIPNDPAIATLDSNELLALVNYERTKTGVAPLKLDKDISLAAQARADDMVKRDYYGHNDPITKESLVAKTETYNRCQVAGENIDAATSSREVVQEWLNSPPHKAGMLDPASDITGFGIAKYKNYYIVVESFCNLK